MRHSSLFSFRRAIVTGAVTMLAVSGNFAGVQASELPTDGWFHSTIGQEARHQAGSDEPTDGWLHSTVASNDSTSSDSTTDGWLHSTVAESLPKPNSNDPLVTDTSPVTDGWLHSMIAESARNTAPQTPIAATSSGFPTEIAIGSSFLASMLLAAGIALFLRRRHASIPA
ncbi:MAG: hypothetical protein ACRDJI_06020 [Actinomycetota bacterium]